MKATGFSGSSAVPLWMLTGVAVVMFLRAARELLIPIAIAVLLSYALTPIVVRLQHARIPRLFSAGALLLLIVGTTG